MTKGFLIVDQKMNTMILPWDDEELADMMKRRNLTRDVHTHDTLKELDKDVRAYLKNTYEEAE